MENRIFREASTNDIAQMHVIRNSVKENILSNQGLITYQAYIEYLTLRGKGWVCEIDNTIVGFSIVDLQENNIWALFLNPEFEGRGIATKLQKMMLDWYFSTGKENVWLGTAPNTRAESFYRKSGWKQNGMHGTKEVKFEMSKNQWEVYCSTINP